MQQSSQLLPFVQSVIAPQVPYLVLQEQEIVADGFVDVTFEESYDNEYLASPTKLSELVLLNLAE